MIFGPIIRLTLKSDAIGFAASLQQFNPARVRKWGVSNGCGHAVRKALVIG